MAWRYSNVRRRTETAQQRTAEIVRRQVRKEREMKPRVVKYRFHGQEKRCYALGKIRLRGVHRFLDDFLTQSISSLSPSEIKQADEQTNRANLAEEDTKMKDESAVKSPFTLPRFTSVNHAACDKKRGPMKTIYDAGTRLDRAVQKAIKGMRARPPVQPKQDTWAYTVLRLVTERFEYKPTKAQVLCATEVGCTATEIDFIGTDKEGKEVVVFELKSKSGGSEYWTKRIYAWSAAFLRFCRSKGLDLPQMTLSQSEMDLLQVLCGRILMQAHSERWPNKTVHKPRAKFADLLVIRSPKPDTAEAFRVPGWMAKLADKIYGFMCITG